MKVKENWERELESLLRRDFGFFRAMFHCCGKNWDIILPYVGPDECPYCKEWIEPINYEVYSNSDFQYEEELDDPMFGIDNYGVW